MPQALSFFTTHSSPPLVMKEAKQPPRPAWAATLCAQMSARQEAAGLESLGSSPNLVTREHPCGSRAHVLPPKPRGPQLME